MSRSLLLSLLLLSTAQADSSSGRATSLRAQGYAGLEKALATGNDQLIDEVAQQRDAKASRLFWHTDLDEAKAEATRTGKPILSLRLLGDLTQEYTCANSRFFRSALYSNPEISEVMRDQFVLHWSSERDVPVITLDFGDGRVMKSTITGNSIHYVLDADGRPIDAIPGLYGPAAFGEELQAAVELSATLDGVAAEQRGALLRVHHGSRLAEEGGEMVADLSEVRGTTDLAYVQQDLITAWMVDARKSDDLQPAAVVPMRFAVAKRMVEMPTLQRIDKRKGGAPENRTGSVGWLPPQEAEWSQLAQLHLEDARLADASVELMRAEGSSQDFDAVVAGFELAMAEDTVRNSYLMRPRIRSWFASGTAPQDLTELNRRVYDELFLTPAGDPTLGMVSPDAYTGLDGDGWQ